MGQRMRPLAGARRSRSLLVPLALLLPTVTLAARTLTQQNNDAGAFFAALGATTPPVRAAAAVPPRQMTLRSANAMLNTAAPAAATAPAVAAVPAVTAAPAVATAPAAAAAPALATAPRTTLSGAAVAAPTAAAAVAAPTAAAAVAAPTATAAVAAPTAAATSTPGTRVVPASCRPLSIGLAFAPEKDPKTALLSALVGTVSILNKGPYVAALQRVGVRLCGTGPEGHIRVEAVCPDLDAVAGETLTCTWRAVLPSGAQLSTYTGVFTSAQMSLDGERCASPFFDVRTGLPTGSCSAKEA